ncbi:glycosyltransferase family 2 protein [Paracrocinitomix mangrovi]|uniref:cellulose synthase family protein n=1 Tax=Paracrocinitomix mangrovi TaxID=2862509 RepID=UPI001C8D2BD6|nr:cellulose synthase family protein [Paracrocinitomix mangrovi]UKN01724.1 glycosyltransferase family 2 protein [Paracrocinitomix mangrovi]
MSFIFLYSIVQLSLLINYLKSKRSIVKKERSEFDINNYPQVTIQLPIYNEYYVVERLIDSICQFNYPKDKLEIQILDDSNDETTDIISSKVHFYQLQGFDIKQIQRVKRTGYKAGALKYGTSIAKGEFIAIFDADFLPDADFLLKTIPHFKDENIGVVQTKWEYTNEDYSFLTKLQAFGLNAHFTIEQTGRNYGNHFINFNGTAGVWRKSCILDAGDWQSDTLTEDLDLSYRAQLKKWKFVYLENVGSPSELPVDINALKAQQFRWTKGAAECVKKNLFKVIVNKEVKLSTKTHAIFHLMNSSIFVFVFIISLLSFPLTWAKSNMEEYSLLFNISSFFMISWLILASFYFVAFIQDKQKSILSYFWKFPLFLSISMALGLHNSLAVIEGYIGKKSPFIRTPKFNITEKSDNWSTGKYAIKKVGLMTYLEGALLLYFIWGFQCAIQLKDYQMLPLYILLIVGYSTVFLSSIFHWKRSVKEEIYQGEYSKS